MASQAFKKFMPLFDRVLVQRFAPELRTKGGIVIPEKSSGKVLKATVVATGPGLADKDGKVRPLNVAAGDKVLLPEYGGTTVTLENEDYFLFRDTDILGKFQE
uniref:10 kDa heat shock protein, mitochondrial n=1 Tax=Phallusia mammillata TaxID=59560 RepID=A0A6F9DFL4_9ASCI|nr:10 kDa heat shock protein, mitochondrial-like [Phallusia mammillata]